MHVVAITISHDSNSHYLADILREKAISCWVTAEARLITEIMFHR